MGWLLVRVDPRHARTDQGGFGANQRRLGAGERGLGALASGAGAGDRRALEGLGILEFGLIGEGKLEHGARLVERQLLDVSPGLGMVEGLLTHVPGGLFAIDPGLIVSQIAIDPRLLLSPDAAGIAAGGGILPEQVFVGDLFLVDPHLVAVTEQLLPIPDGLLEIAQALFNGQLLRA